MYNFSSGAQALPLLSTFFNNFWGGNPRTSKKSVSKKIGRESQLASLLLMLRFMKYFCVTLAIDKQAINNIFTLFFFLSIIYIELKAAVSLEEISYACTCSRYRVPVRFTFSLYCTLNLQYMIYSVTRDGKLPLAIIWQKYYHFSYGVWIVTRPYLGWFQFSFYHVSGMCANYK